jgi:hypothetical protein
MQAPPAQRPEQQSLPALHSDVAPWQAQVPSAPDDVAVGALHVPPQQSASVRHKLGLPLGEHWHTGAEK